jgi:NAD(P)-dependent dehydrogenase (short-subunit alcohol dehydrogenase family)
MNDLRQLYIVTGASRGLGLAVARQLLQRADARVLTISRRPSDELAASPRLEQWAQDLAHPIEAAARLDTWLRSIAATSLARAALINNAGVAPPPGPLDAAEPLALSNALRVGLEAPLLLTAAFLRATRDWRCERRVLNVSSGLGRRAMAGTAAYCAAKAGMDHFSRAAALEGATIVSLAPGVIDTDMQVALRASDPTLFPDRERFVQLKQSGALDAPAAAAAKLIAYLERRDFGAEPVADVRG